MNNTGFQAAQELGNLFADDLTWIFPVIFSCGMFLFSERSKDLL